MAILPIITAPDPILRRVSAPVEKVDNSIRRLMDDMLESMYQAPGIGLSAIQVGVQKRVIVVDVTHDEEARNPLCLVNPEILSASATLVTYEEGCLSLPDQYADVARPDHIEIQHLDRDGEMRKLVADGLLATCIQHEMDHLEGKLFVDHLTALKRNMIMRKLQKVKRQRAIA